MKLFFVCFWAAACLARPSVQPFGHRSPLGVRQHSLATSEDLKVQHFFFCCGVFFFLWRFGAGVAKKLFFFKECHCECCTWSQHANATSFN